MQRCLEGAFCAKLLGEASLCFRGWDVHGGGGRQCMQGGMGALVDEWDGDRRACVGRA